MALDGTYAGLLASVPQWLDRTDFGAIVPDLVTLAEARIARDMRLRNQITTTVTNTTAGTATIALPTGWLEFENLSLNTTPGRSLSYETPEQLEQRFPSGYGSARPAAYTIIGLNLVLAPTPDDAYPVELVYYKKFDPLVSAGTNWLMTNYPSIYLNACLAEAAAFLDQDDARIARWEAKYRAEVKSLASADDTSIRSGSALRVRAIV